MSRSTPRFIYRKIWRWYPEFWIPQQILIRELEMPTETQVISHLGAGCGDYDALVATYCHNCFIRVVGFKYEDDPRSNVMYIAGFSSHDNSDQQSWKWRFKRVWRILRGSLDPKYEFMSRDEVDNLLTALTQCRDSIFGGEEKTDTD